MKNVIFVFFVSFTALAYASTTPDQQLVNYTQGEELHVLAQSGLKLRSEPDRLSRVLALMDYGDQVTVINDSVSWKAYDRIDWLDGHWVYVEYGNLRGYAFDAFLSALPMPFFGYDENLCEDLPLLLEMYISDLSYDGYMTLDAESEIEEVLRSDSSAISRVFPDGHYMTFVKNNGNTTTQISLSGVRMSEAYHIMMNVLDYCPDKSEILEELVYHQEGNRIVRIDTPQSERLTIQLNSDNTLLIVLKSPCQTTPGGSASHRYTSDSSE